MTHFLSDTKKKLTLKVAPGLKHPKYLNRMHHVESNKEDQIFPDPRICLGMEHSRECQGETKTTHWNQDNH